MQEGLLWFDNNPSRKLADKVKQAANCYKTKLKKKPTVCYINANQFDTSVDKINGIRLKPAINIQPHHFWIGVEHGSKVA